MAPHAPMDDAHKLEFMNLLNKIRILNAKRRPKGRRLNHLYPKGLFCVAHVKAQMAGDGKDIFVTTATHVHDQDMILWQCWC